MKDVGNIIFEQLKVLGKVDLMAWGAKNFTTFKEVSFKKDLSHLGGLFFKVNGLLHKQKVMIRLKGNDTYHIEIGDIRKGKWIKRKDSKTHTNVYFDEMIEVIDGLVEGTINLTPEQAKTEYIKNGELFF